ncbi:hypothetical protein BV898_18525 [Hypsibius exemplaris]|uniref:ZP domain-containing protein n=1 Tax=Hypsibius exemplaris TaxID=2072580 RepID=A0A9X6RN76_HYPEX|nr:hypothetical protein BV898_18525 [Hypsibius exemplaris]
MFIQMFLFLSVSMGYLERTESSACRTQYFPSVSDGVSFTISPDEVARHCVIEIVGPLGFGLWISSEMDTSSECLESLSFSDATNGEERGLFTHGCANTSMTLRLKGTQTSSVIIIIRGGYGSYFIISARATCDKLSTLSTGEEQIAHLPQFQGIMP